MITTEWVYINRYLEYRYKGPKWIAFLIVKSGGKKVNSIVGHIFQFIFKLFGTKMQYRTRGANYD